MNMNETTIIDCTNDIGELASALAQAQGEIQPAILDGKNPHFNSKFATLLSIRSAVRDTFAKHGLSVVQIPSVVDGQLRLETLLLHSSGQRLHCGELAANVDAINPQKMGSAITYFRRYALAAVSQCVADEDDDGNAATGKPTAKAKGQTKAQQINIDSTLELIEGYTDAEELREFGQQKIKKEPGIIQTAVFPRYTEKMAELEG